MRARYNNGTRLALRRLLSNSRPAGLCCWNRNVRPNTTTKAHVVFRFKPSGCPSPQPSSPHRSSRREEAPTSFSRNRMSLLTSAATRFMGREHLQNSDVNRGHEPDRHPSPCPLHARRGEGGRRPGEGRFMESPLSFFACIGTMNHPPHPPSGHPLPLRGGEGWGEGAVHGETSPNFDRALRP